MAPDFETLPRLDFSLPEFTRFAWVSEKARETWEPRLVKIRRAWSQVEWLSILSGVRTCALTQLNPSEFIEASALLMGKGLSALHLQIDGVSRSYVGATRTPKIGEPLAFRIAIGEHEHLIPFKHAWLTSSREQIGALLGYPPCCRAFFQRVWVEKRCVDTTWPRIRQKLKIRIRSFP